MEMLLVPQVGYWAWHAAMLSSRRMVRMGSRGICPGLVAVVVVQRVVRMEEGVADV